MSWASKILITWEDKSQL